MKYLLTTLTLLLFLGCSNQGETQASINDTTALQPDIQNKELQPPRPPEL